MDKLPRPLLPGGSRAGFIAYDAIPDANWCKEFIRRVEQDDRAPSFIHVNDGRLALPDSLINLAVRDPETRSFVSSAAALGYLQYYGTEREARLVHRSRISNVWQPVRSGSISVSSRGILHTVAHRLPKEEISRLLVVFSGVALRPRSSSLWRYFETNFKHIDANIPGDTAVLRISDLGGVLGAFYMDTTDKPDMSDSIRSLIIETASDFGVDPSSICLLGSSKGATGAVHHGISLKTPFVAVEPILSDDHYEEHLHDIHFTGGPGFLERKARLFERLAAHRDYRDPQGYIFTSPASPQYPYIDSFAKATRGVPLIVTNDSRISDHPDVARTVLGPTVAMVNSILLGWPRPTTSMTI